MKDTYRKFLVDMDYDTLLAEADMIWGVENPEMYSAEELIEMMVGFDEGSQFK